MTWLPVFRKDVGFGAMSFSGPKNDAEEGETMYSCPPP